MPCSPAKIFANRKNALRSTGPKRPETKAISRANSLKHGLTGAGVVLPPEMADQLDRAAGAWAGHLRPQDDAEHWHVRRIALMALRMDRLAAAELWAVAANRARMLLNWDEDRALAAEDAGAKLQEDPARAVMTLRSTSAGCLWLAARWERLARRLDRGEPWTDAEQAEASDLLAFAPADRDDEEATALRARTADREAMLRDIRETIDELAAKAEELAEDAEGPERRAIEADVHFDDSPAIRRIRRYEAACQRTFDRSLRELAARRPEASAAALREAEEVDPLGDDGEEDMGSARLVSRVASPPPRPAPAVPAPEPAVSVGARDEDRGTGAVLASASAPTVTAEEFEAILAEPYKGKAPAGRRPPDNFLPIRILG